jgi:hypothetical protein
MKIDNKLNVGQTKMNKLITLDLIKQTKWIDYVKLWSNKKNSKMQMVQ